MLLLVMNIHGVRDNMYVVVTSICCTCRHVNGPSLCGHSNQYLNKVKCNSEDTSERFCCITILNVKTASSSSA